MTEGYPHHLVGDPAPPPEQVDGRVLGMALKVHARRLEAIGHELQTAAPWRLCYALEQLVDEANAAVPNRNRASDGAIGDARHQQGASDHNPGPIVGGRAIVRADDITNDPRLNLPAVAERIRARAHAGELPQVVNGGYAILNGRITAEDWSGWHVYKGDDPHVSHLHLSASREAGRFDLRTVWGVFSTEHAPTPPRPAPPAPAPAPRPAPAPPGPPKGTGHDLTGSGAALRGQEGDSGPRVGALQEFLRRYGPAYAGDLVVDREWGPKTSAAVREFAHRSSIPSSDGRNIGPQLAGALWRAGLFRPLSAARARVLGHVNRADRR